MFLVTGALPLFAWTVIYTSDENPKELFESLMGDEVDQCEFECVMERFLCLSHANNLLDEYNCRKEYEDCLNECSDDSLQSITPEVLDDEELLEYLEDLLDNSSYYEALEELLDSGDLKSLDGQVDTQVDTQVELQQLQDIGEIVCKAKCKVKYEECADVAYWHYDYESALEECKEELEECRDNCEDNDDTLNSIMRNLQVD